MGPGDYSFQRLAHPVQWNGQLGGGSEKPPQGNKNAEHAQLLQLSNAIGTRIWVQVLDFIWDMNPRSTVREMEKKNEEEKEDQYKYVTVGFIAVDKQGSFWLRTL